MNQLISDKYIAWKTECNARFRQLQANEEELNRIFIDIYGLQDELTPEVSDKDVTVHFVVDSKEDIPASMQGSNYILTKCDMIVSLISYAVGCMFGRYSLDVEGLAYAGGEWDASKYTTYPADKDNIIPICDDEYFEDDIVGRFVKFIETVYGSDTLEENLKFIADALGGNGTPRDVIRSYFLSDFYADHCKTYQKRPIYWLFDISYAVGCMFGRYSLDVEGLAYAGGEWDASKYTTYPADKDNIIPICDDEYFEDDIVGRFVKFIETVYGSDTLEENLKFIADALGGNGTPRDVIRSYFLSDFYADHCKTYQKRPIYWLFDSGKKNGFKALIYMHRYQPDTIARIRTDYVHEQQARYRTAIAGLEDRVATAATGERMKLNKQLKKLQEQDTELRAYEEKIHHLADQMIAIDLDDGVKVNYAKFQDVLGKIK